MKLIFLEKKLERVEKFQCGYLFSFIFVGRVETKRFQSVQRCHDPLAALDADYKHPISVKISTAAPQKNVSFQINKKTDY